ncbi:GNAT family N-acetyltransferase [Actinobacillus indolicus]|uniref:GNAT family N-acetyltransferase n=1 Tax=Actinobacillus indolicus TaxID=51049 RepID=A0A4V1AXU2_9PAST|nr:GNAT family N-acetyltransferase [Actinobacillus indolicus]QBQ63060.1 GNAT family N-acetyltransferase [Actinobacillus indolicus]
MEFREITLQEEEIYQQLLHTAYKPVVELGIHFAASNMTLSDIRRHLESNLVYGLFVEGKLVSSVSLRLPWGNNPGPFGVPHIGLFATNPTYKKQGYALKLLIWLEEAILKKQLKVPFVTLGTAENHPWLSQFYINQGFSEIGRANLTDDHTTIYFRKVINTTLFEQWQTRKAQ